MNASSCGLECGHGTCVAGVCVCDAGYMYDRIRYRFDNCYMSTGAEMGLVISCAAVGFGAALLALFVASRNRSSARVIASIAGVEAFISGLVAVIQHVEGGCHYATWMLCFTLFAPLFIVSVSG